MHHSSQGGGQEEASVRQSGLAVETKGRLSKPTMAAVKGTARLLALAGQAKPSPQIGQALGPLGVNMMEFCKQFNSKTETYKETALMRVKLVVRGLSCPCCPPCCVILRYAIARRGLAGAASAPTPLHVIGFACHAPVRV